MKSALPQAALAIGAHAIAVLVGGGWNNRGKGTGNKSEQSGKNNEALHLIFPLRIGRAGGTDAND
jgi:hypothetical protein